MRDCKILIWGSILFFLMLLPCLGKEKDKLGSSLKPVSEILNPDGTLNLREGVEGSFDPRDYRMIAKPGEAPRFVPMDRMNPERDLPQTADGYWDSRFCWTGTNWGVGALAVSGDKLYVGGSLTSAGGVTVNRIAVWDGMSWSPPKEGNK